MTEDELIEKWRRNDNPRVRDAWVDRELFSSTIAWEKGQPYRVIRDDHGRPRHEPVPRWTTNTTLAKQLGRKVGPLRLTGEEPPEVLCLKALLRHLQTKGGLWRDRAAVES